MNMQFKQSALVGIGFTLLLFFVAQYLAVRNKESLRRQLRTDRRNDYFELGDHWEDRYALRDKEDELLEKEDDLQTRELDLQKKEIHFAEKARALLRKGKDLQKKEGSLRERANDLREREQDLRDSKNDPHSMSEGMRSEKVRKIEESKPRIVWDASKEDAKVKKYEIYPFPMEVWRNAEQETAMLRLLKRSGDWILFGMPDGREVSINVHTLSWMCQARARRYGNKVARMKSYTGTF